MVDLLQVLEVALLPLYSADISVLLETFLGFFGVIFLIGEEIYLGGIVLQDMCHYAESNACGAAGHDINLA